MSCHHHSYLPIPTWQGLYIEKNVVLTTTLLFHVEKGFSFFQQEFSYDNQLITSQNFRSILFFSVHLCFQTIAIFAKHKKHAFICIR
mgnify:CR=1 FL=1